MNISSRNYYRHHVYILIFSRNILKSEYAIQKKRIYKIKNELKLKVLTWLKKCLDKNGPP